MKKFKVFILSSVMVLMLFSCQSEDEIQELNIENTESGKDIKGIGKGLPKGPSS